MIKGYNPDSKHMYTKPKKGLGKKVLDGVKYVGKNSWTILPFANGYYLLKESINLKETRKYKSFPINILGRAFLTAMYVGWGIISYDLGSINPKMWEAKVQERILHKVEDKKNRLHDELENAVNFEDSLKIYQKNNLEKNIKLNEPSFEDKEKIFNKIEGGKNGS